MQYNKINKRSIERNRISGHHCFNLKVKTQRNFITLKQIETQKLTTELVSFYYQKLSFELEGLLINSIFCAKKRKEFYGSD